MKLTPTLETFWLTFPKNPNMPFGIGVTAFSEQDAFQLLEECGISAWLKDAHEISLLRGVTIQDLDPRNIVPNIGPIQFRGVWYPCMNIGFGAPGTPEYKSFRIKKF
jgi:hypothetical protein